MAAVAEFRVANSTQVFTGERIVNVGTVMNTRTEGAFIYMDIRIERWSPVTGTVVTTTETRFYHHADEIVLEP